VGHRVFPLAVDSGQSPAIELPRTGTVTTGSMSALRRPTRELPPEAFVLTPTPRDETATKRRSRGTLIALLLLVVFLVVATWVVYRSAEQAVKSKPPITRPAGAGVSAQRTPTAADPAASSPNP
jgi:hypothetical protein